MGVQTRRRSRRLSLGLSAAVLTAVALPTVADPLLEDERPSTVAQTHSVDLVQASKIARAELGGEIIKAELTRYRGLEVYMVRLLDQGRVREALVDAATGEMLLPGQTFLEPNEPGPNEESE